jgi:molybdopterin molybdotransferase
VIGFDEAWAIVAAAARPLGSEQVALRDAHNRTLAEPVVALVDWPPSDVSAMDGYAVREAEFAGGLRSFPVAGASYPAAPFTGEPGPGSSIRIFTGAPIPGGFDRVIVQEMVRREGDTAVIEGEPSAARHIRVQGSDFRAGDVLLEPGRRLDPRALVGAAGADVAEVVVWSRPRVAILGTGDELVEPGQARAHPGSIPESVSAGVAALVEEWGGVTVARDRARDDPAVIEAAASAALDAADVVVVTGGASVGEKDFAKPVFDRFGLELLFSKVAIKPGKPVWFGRARGKLVLGLPGNPTSAMVTARLFLAPLLAGLAGRDPREAARWRRGSLARELGPNGDRETFVRGRADGESAQPLGDQDSGAQKVMADADLLIRRPIDAPAVPVGATVDVLDF